jgi:hypothetical protein
MLSSATPMLSTLPPPGVTMRTSVRQSTLVACVCFRARVCCVSLVVTSLSLWCNGASAVLQVPNPVQAPELAASIRPGLSKLRMFRSVRAAAVCLLR